MTPSLIGGHRNATVLQPLPEQHQAGPVPRQDLQSVRPLRPENEQRPRERVLPQMLAHQGGETVGAAPEVDRPGRHQDPDPCRNRDHAAALTARSTVAKVTASIPGGTRTVAAPITISILAEPPGQAGTIGPSACDRERLYDHRREARPVLAGIAFRLLPRCPTPAEQLLRRQPVPARNRRHRLAVRKALRDYLRPLISRPTAAPSRPGEDFHPAHRRRLLRLRFVQKLCVRHVSNPPASARRRPSPIKALGEIWGQRAAYGQPAIFNSRFAE